MKFSERETVTDFINAYESTFISCAGAGASGSHALKEAFLLGCSAAFVLSVKAFEQGDFYKRLEDFMAEANDISDNISHE